MPSLVCARCAHPGSPGDRFGRIIDLATPDGIVGPCLPIRSDLHNIIRRASRIDRCAKHADHVGDTGLVDVAVRILGLESVVVVRRRIGDWRVDLTFRHQTDHAFAVSPKAAVIPEPAA